MPDWVLVIVGIAAGLGLVYVILLVCFRLEDRRSKRKSWLAEPSNQWDNSSDVGGGPHGGSS